MKKEAAKEIIEKHIKIDWDGKGFYWLSDGQGSLGLGVNNTEDELYDSVLEVIMGSGAEDWSGFFTAKSDEIVEGYGDIVAERGKMSPQELEDKRDDELIEDGVVYNVKDYVCPFCGEYIFLHFLDGELDHIGTECEHKAYYVDWDVVVTT